MYRNTFFFPVQDRPALRSPYPLPPTQTQTPSPPSPTKTPFLPSSLLAARNTSSVHNISDLDHTLNEEGVRVGPDTPPSCYGKIMAP